MQGFHVSQLSLSLQVLRKTHSETLPQPYSAARARKIKIYSNREIQFSEMVKLYQVFWNNKAEDICSSHALKQFLPGEIQSDINVAWMWA